MNRLALSESELALVLEILRTHVPHAEVWVYGSRITGEAKQYSDIDLALTSKEPLDLTTLQDAFLESDLPYLVDLTDWARTSPEFRAIIERDHIVIQKPA